MKPGKVELCQGASEKFRQVFKALCIADGKGNIQLKAVLPD